MPIQDETNKYVSSRGAKLLLISLTAMAVLAVIALIALPATENPSQRPFPAASPLASPVASDAWLESFSLRSYRPMLRLASRDDGHYLKSARAGAEGKQYRRAQRALLREYLCSLARDFHQLNAIAAEKTRCAGGGEGELPMPLSEQRIAFIFLMWNIEVRLMLRALIPHSIDLQPLLANVENLAAQTREMIRQPLRYRLPYA
jgi:hypothetical protein